MAVCVSLKTIVVRCLLVFVMTVGVLQSGPGRADSPSKAALWAALKTGEAVAIMRHALAPGIGDPANFKIGDCTTQRNLSDEGRQQSRTIGARFRQNGISAAKVYSSEWCRCRETGELLGFGPVTPLPIANSFFRRYERQDAQTKALKAWLPRGKADTPIVLVSHQVNISALTGRFTRSGEILVVRTSQNGAIEVLGSL